LMLAEFVILILWWQSNMGLGQFVPLHWEYDKRSRRCLNSSKGNGKDSSEPTHICNSMQILCTPLWGWDASRSYKRRPGLYLDFKLRILFDMHFCWIQKCVPF
jgi:hypothetical protein